MASHLSAAVERPSGSSSIHIHEGGTIQTPLKNNALIDPGSSRLISRPRPSAISFAAATMLSLGNLQPRQLLSQILNFALVLSTAFMLWKGLSIASDSPSPIVVVLSGSMEPAFQRGDLLFLWNRGQDTQIGEIVVYNVKGKDIPIVHRVVRRYGGGWVSSFGE